MSAEVVTTTQHALDEALKRADDAVANAKAACESKEKLEKEIEDEV